MHNRSETADLFADDDPNLERAMGAMVGHDEASKRQTADIRRTSFETRRIAHVDFPPSYRRLLRDGDEEADKRVLAGRNGEWVTEQQGKRAVGIGGGGEMREAAGP
jgi:hypothetical protein